MLLGYINAHKHINCVAKVTHKISKLLMFLFLFCNQQTSIFSCCQGDQVIGVKEWHPSIKGERCANIIDDVTCI